MVHDESDKTALERLAADLESRGLLTRPLTAAGPVRMKVTNPSANVMSETVISHAGAFWWPWRDRIGSGDDIQGAGSS